jgi:hypothetical protein
MNVLYCLIMKFIYINKIILILFMHRTNDGFYAWDLAL